MSRTITADMEAFRLGATALVNRRPPPPGFHALCDRLAAHAERHRLQLHPDHADLADLWRRLSPSSRPKLLRTVVLEFRDIG